MEKPEVLSLDNHRENDLNLSLAQKCLKAIEKDKNSYTLEVDEVKVQESLLKRELSRNYSKQLSRQLSKRYPGIPITQALRNENEMLRQELQR